MSFEPYSEAKKNIKVAPVKIINNETSTSFSSQTTKFPQLNLQFPLENPFYNCQQRGVTIPLSFLQQLIQQAQVNKILQNHFCNPQLQQMKHEESEAVNKLITQIQYQPNKSQNPINEDRQIQTFLLKNQLDFLKENQISISKIEQFFADNLNLLPHFQKWIQSLNFRSIEEMLLLCYSNPNSPQKIRDIFYTLFLKLSIEFYLNHAYAIVLRSNIDDKVKYLSMIGSIIKKLAKPQGYFYFNGMQ